ncbi:uncharacterized protein [Lepeophtheirus salmonis]|nr:uncharacterized protein LOC121127006 [Lepeophtheirus salmonis]
MLVHPGDLIPVQEDAIQIPWTRRKSQILSYLHRGSVTFETFVYDTNVGDISSLSTYFNPERWTVDDLNHKFAQTPDSDKAFASAVADGGNNCNPDLTSKFTELQKNASSSVLPRLLVCPDDSMSEKEKQTIQWVILQSTVKTMKNGHSENRTQAVITPESPDGVFLPWDGISSSKKCSPLGYSKYSSNVWRPSDTGILSPFLWDKSFLDSWPSGSTLLSSSSNHSSSPDNLTKVNHVIKTKEDFLLGESLLENIASDFIRNETLV